MTNVYLVMWLENRKQKNWFSDWSYTRTVFNVAILSQMHIFIVKKELTHFFSTLWGLWAVFVLLCGHMLGWESWEGKEGEKLNTSSATVMCDVKLAHPPFHHWRPFCRTRATTPFVYKQHLVTACFHQKMGTIILYYFIIL